MTKRTRYGGEGCGWIWAAHIIILAEISSENLLPIRADFVTERDKAERQLQIFCMTCKSVGTRFSPRVR